MKNVPVSSFSYYYVSVLCKSCQKSLFPLSSYGGGSSKPAGQGAAVFRKASAKVHTFHDMGKGFGKKLSFLRAKLIRVKQNTKGGILIRCRGWQSHGERRETAAKNAGKAECCAGVSSRFFNRLFSKVLQGAM
jgi:hypothetical protein